MAKKGRRIKRFGTGVPDGIVLPSTGIRGNRQRSVKMTPKPQKGTRSAKEAKAFRDQKENS